MDKFQLAAKRARAAVAGEGSSSHKTRLLDLYYATRSKSARIASDLYEPLEPAKQHIRILEVKAGVRNDPVHCTLRRVSLLDEPKPTYETISYVWGDSKKRGTVYLHGRLADVPLSAVRALRRIRLPDRTRTVWIDAICIDQTDNLERSQQVALMAQIYESGHSNLIWLGKDDGGTEQALSDLSRIVKNMRMETNDLAEIRDILWDVGGETRFADKPLAVHVEDWDNLMLFFADAWYSRLWVVQEAALATQNICFRGEFEFELSLVLRAAVWVYHHAYSLNVKQLWSWRRALVIADFAEKQLGRYTLLPESGWSLLNLLVESQDLHVTDPRDHVYGTLGLVRRFTRINDIPWQLQPDYNVSLATLFARAMKSEVAERGDLDVLNQVSHRYSGERGDFPTWVMRLDQATDWDVDAKPLMRNDFRADHGVLYGPELSVSSPHILAARGIKADQIVELTPILKVRQSHASDATHELDGLLMPVQRIVQDRDKRVGNPVSASTVASTLVGGTGTRRTPIGEDDCLSLYEAYCQCIEDGRFPIEPDELLASDGEMAFKASEYREAMGPATHNRLVFTTEGGMLGLGPQSTKLGDVVAILYGGRTPFILRPVDGTAEADHEFVGECYVHGIMNGEAVVEHRANAGADVMFYLR